MRQYLAGNLRPTAGMLLVLLTQVKDEFSIRLLKNSGIFVVGRFRPGSVDHPGEGRQRPAGYQNTLALLLHLNLQGQRICLVLDTGLGQIVMYNDRLHKHFPHLELTGAASETHEGHLKGQMVNLPGLRLGSHDAQAPVFLIERAPASLPDDIDGFLGLRALRVPVVELNFEANNLAVGASESTRASLMKLDTLKTDAKQGPSRDRNATLVFLVTQTRSNFGKTAARASSLPLVDFAVIGAIASPQYRPAICR